MSGGYNLQLAIFDKLNSDVDLSALVVGIYDNVTQVANPDDNNEFPFLTISQGRIAPWDDDLKRGGQADIEIHTWSRAHNALEAKQVMDAVYNCLHRATIVINGWSFVGCDLVDQVNPMRDPDGVTRHGVQTYRITYEEL